MAPKSKTDCPCEVLLKAREDMGAMSDAYHQLANECEKLMASQGDRRGMRRVFYKCYYPQNRVGRLISFFGNGPISHVSFVFPKPTDIGVMARPGEYRYIDCTLEEYRTMVAFAFSTVGSKYDKPGIMGFVTRKRMEDPEKWFCSENLSTIALRGGHPLSHKHPSSIDPTDCWASVGGTPCDKSAVMV